MVSIEMTGEKRKSSTLLQLAARVEALKSPLPSAVEFHSFILELPRDVLSTSLHFGMHFKW